MEIGGDRLGTFPLTVRRAFVGCALVPCAVTVGNHYFGWGLFGGGDVWPIVASFALLFLVMRYLGPTVQQLREHREARGRPPEK